MSEMQWLLLVLAIVIVAGAYLYIRRQAHDDPWQGMDEAGDPSDPYDADRGMSLGGDSYIVGVRTIGQPQTSSQPEAAQEPEQPERLESAHNSPVSNKKSPPWTAFSTNTKTYKKPAPGADELRPKRAPAGEQKLFIVHVASRDHSFFDGPDVHAALTEQKLKFGMHNIYHRVTEANGVPDSVYSVANMLKPGFLDPVEQDHLSTPGLTLFLQLPGPIDGVTAARDMLATAGALAEHLGGQVLDDKRSLLKAQSAQFMLDEAAELDRRQRVQAQR